MLRKFESLMGKFIWKFSGKILRIALEDLKNPKLSGGLQLPCLANMSNALISSQCVRLIRSGDKKSIHHLEFWLGDLIGALSTNFVAGTTAAETPPYFEKIGLLLADLMISDSLNITNICSASNKIFYRFFMSTLPPPKVVREAARDFSKVWKRLYYRIFSTY